jgi:hypothetical protein
MSAAGQNDSSRATAKASEDERFGDGVMKKLK